MEKGLIAGFLAEDTAGKYEVTVSVTDANRGTTDSKMLILKVAKE